MNENWEWKWLFLDTTKRKCFVLLSTNDIIKVIVAWLLLTVQGFCFFFVLMMLIFRFKYWLSVNNIWSDIYVWNRMIAIKILCQNRLSTNSNDFFIKSSALSRIIYGKKTHWKRHLSRKIHMFLLRSCNFRTLMISNLVYIIVVICIAADCKVFLLGFFYFQLNETILALVLSKQSMISFLYLWVLTSSTHKIRTPFSYGFSNLSFFSLAFFPFDNLCIFDIDIGFSSLFCFLRFWLANHSHFLHMFLS